MMNDPLPVRHADYNVDTELFIERHPHQSAIDSCLQVIECVQRVLDNYKSTYPDAIQMDMDCFESFRLLTNIATNIEYNFDDFEYAKCSINV